MFVYAYSDHLYVLYTNYRYAVVYMCINKHFEDCSSSADANILILSHTKYIPPDVTDRLISVVNTICIKEVDLIFITDSGMSMINYSKIIETHTNNFSLSLSLSVCVCVCVIYVNFYFYRSLWVPTSWGTM